MRKIFLIIAMLFAASMSFAQILPEDFEAYLSSTKKNDNNVIVEAIVDFALPLSTKYGTINVREKSKITFYENGNLKTFSTNDIIELEESYGRIRVKSVSTASRVKPIVLFEDGTIKEAYIVHSSDKTKNKVNTVLGEMYLRGDTQISFYHNRDLESFTPYSIFETDFNGEKIQLAIDKIAVYENGSIKEFTPVKSLTLNGIPTMNKKPVTFFEDGSVESIYPDRQAKIKIGNKFVGFIYGEILEYYPNKTFKTLNLDVTGKDVEIAGIKIFAETEKEIINPKTSGMVTRSATSEPCKINVAFYESSKIKSVSTKNTADSYSFRSAMGFVTEIEKDLFASLSELKFYDNGVMEVMSFDNALEFSLSEDADFYAWKFIYNKNNKMVAEVGNLVRGGDRFYVDQEACILIIGEDGKTITDIITNENEMITASTNVILNEQGRPAFYTATSRYDDSTVTKEIILKGGKK